MNKEKLRNAILKEINKGNTPLTEEVKYRRMSLMTQLDFYPEKSI